MDAGRLEQNVKAVRDRIAAACARAGRDRGSVTLVGVTKTVGPEVAEALIDLGVCDLGENRVQDAARKREALGGRSVRWHMIGHLQTNKVKEALGLFDLIHSVDSFHVAEALDRRAAGEGRAVRVLVQVNVSGEESKHGIPAASAVDEIRRIAGCAALDIEGLMTMAPFVDDAETVRPVFRRLREVAAEVRALGLECVEMTQLSMGMTQDFEVAVEEGATLVRIGTALFAGIGTG